MRITMSSNNLVWFTVAVGGFVWVRVCVGVCVRVAYIRLFCSVFGKPNQIHLLSVFQR